MRGDGKLVLEDGEVYAGLRFGARKDAVCEVVFNTSMVGYQEIASDPSYTDQAVVMSYPPMGNYGLADEDFESKVIAPSAFVVRDLCEDPSNFRSTRTFGELLEDSGVPGLRGVDTRRLVRSIRDLGARRGILTDADVSVEEAQRRIRETGIPCDAVRRCSSTKKWYSRTSHPRFHVVAIDCGMKLGILRMFKRYHCNVTVVPYDTGSEEILSLRPDGVFVSNGPGDPMDVVEVIETLKSLRGVVPLFGICLGHQLVALSCGAKTYRLRFGHRGGNHPVKDLATGRVEITSQNHGYAVLADSLAGTGLEVSRINLLDQTVEGLIGVGEPILTVQYHPESSPGPQDSEHIFGLFCEMMGR